MVTEKQKNNLHRLSSDDLIDIMHECAEALGVVSVTEYCELMLMDRYCLNRQIRSGKIKHVNIGGKKFPLINE